MTAWCWTQQIQLRGWAKVSLKLGRCYSLEDVQLARQPKLVVQTMFASHAVEQQASLQYEHIYIFDIDIYTYVHIYGHPPRSTSRHVVLQP